MGGFEWVFLMVLVVFVVVVIAIVVALVRKGTQAAHNNAAPEVGAVATVADKRVAISGGGEMAIHEAHFVTFEQPGGERFELEVPASQYGLLVVGDQGTVTMKGTRYLGFSRELLR